VNGKRFLQVEDPAKRISAPLDQSSSEDQHTAMLPNPLSDSAQRAINQYRIISLLGKGGMGEVWLAEDTKLKRKVALKLLPAEFTNDTDRLRRFEQEALAISALNHPNIITIHEIGESEAGRFIVMELVAGRTLRTLAAESLSPKDLIASLIAWGSQLAKALHVAHAAGITHRDIKPDNIMVRDDGYVKVLDFGLARLDASRENFGEADSMAGTKSGVLLGTVKYMSPEQARGEKVTSATDIFALGILFYELATGTHPFSSATLLGTLQQITFETPLPPSRLNSDISAALESLILRMLAKQASARPSAVEIEQALSELSGQRSSLQLQRPARTVSERHTVGREQERAELQAGFASALSGRGQLLCVAGEPGIGKTTLVEDFLAELAAEGQCTIARGRCSERLAGTEAYLPLLEALEALLRQGGTHSLARTMKPGDEVVGNNAAQLMKHIAPTWYAQVVPLSGDSEGSARLLAEVKAASQERMKRELANFLQAVAERRPLVLFFDDLHWADVSTIDLLSFLSGKFEALKVLIVVTYRPSDMLLAKHPFLQIKPDLQSRGLCRELALGFLTEAEIAEYLALEFPGHRFPPAFSRLIHAKTEGSPLFMADLVRYLCDSRVIRRTDFSLLPPETEQTEAFATASLTETHAMWTLAEALPDIERALPESVRGMIERKIAQLGEDDRKLLTAASVQGYEFDSAVVARVLNLDADEIEERLEKLERVFAFVKLTSEAEFPNGTLTLKYRFVHVLYQNALYVSLRVTRKATLSRDVALALEACYGARSAGVANELALLWEAARDSTRAAEYFLQAARNAAQIHAHQEAVQLARRGLAVLLKLPETPERDGQELGLQLTLGFSLQSVLSWTAPEAGAAFNRARQLCEQVGNDPRLFAALSGVWPYHALQAEFEAAERLGEQMLQLAEQAQDPVLLVRVFMCRAFVHYYQGELVSAHQYGERALALDLRANHAAYLSVSNEDLGITTRRHQSYCLWTLGYADSALALAQETVTLAEQTFHPFSLGGAHLATGMVLHTRRAWQSSQQEFEKVLALAAEYDLGDMLNYAVAFNALNLAYQEPTVAVLERAQQAIAVLRAKGVRLALTGLLAMLGEVYGLAGRAVVGLQRIAEALGLVEHTGERVWEAELWRLKGALLLKANASNAQAEAEGCYHKAIEIAQRQSAKAWELRAATSLARLWQQQGKTAEARQMLAGIYGWFTEGFDTADLKEAKALLDELDQQTIFIEANMSGDLV
jgi:serine/threonine protein kinase/tetratricopeptide (TPR) repeat protein